MDEEQTKIENRQMQMHPMISWLLAETLWTKTHGLLSESLRNFLLAQLQGENHFEIKTSTEKKWKKKFCQQTKVNTEEKKNVFDENSQGYA